MIIINCQSFVPWTRNLPEYYFHINIRGRITYAKASSLQFIVVLDNLIEDGLWTQSIFSSSVL